MYEIHTNVQTTEFAGLHSAVSTSVYNCRDLIVKENEIVMKYNICKVSIKTASHIRGDDNYQCLGK